MHARLQPDQYLDQIVSAFSSGPDCKDLFDRLPVPLYATDADGHVTYYNAAAEGFAGRRPQLGEDRWCVTWKLYTTTGEALPKDKCPMAEAIRQGRPIRDRVAVAERPDGTRSAFRPYPTPIFDDAGKLTGAVNLLIDVTDEQSHALEQQADRCRRLAEATYDRVTATALGAMAEGFERTAHDLRSSAATDQSG